MRAHALGEAPVAFVPLGFGVLRLRGMAAWLAAQRSTATTGGSSMEISTCCERHDQRVAELDEMKCELVRLLAGAALSVTMRSYP